MQKKNAVTIIKIIAILLFAGGLSHWLVIFGLWKEEAPLFISMYFHSLVVLSPLAAIGLWRLKRYGRNLGMFIAITQLPSHTLVIVLRMSSGGIGGDSWRFLDLLFAVFFLIFFNTGQVKELFYGQR